MTPSNIILPFADPLARTYLEYSFIFGLKNRSANFDDWLLSQYSSVCFAKSEAWQIYDEFDLFPGPRIRKCIQFGALEGTAHDLWRHRKEDSASLLEFVSDRMAHGFYCMIALDEFHLPGKGAYQEKHFIHLNLVVAIDHYGKSIALVGYLAGDFGKVWVPFDVFTSAFFYESDGLVKDSGQEIFALTNYKLVWTFRVNPAFAFQLEPKLFQKSFERYLSGRPTEYELDLHNKDLAPLSPRYGIFSYERLLESIDSMVNGTIEVGFHNVRLFSEHKNLAYERVKLAHERGYLNEGELWIKRFFEIKNLASRSRTSLFAWAMSGQKDMRLAQSIVYSIHKCRDLESQVYDQILGAIVLSSSS